MQLRSRRFAGRDGERYLAWLTMREFPWSHGCVVEHVLYFSGTTGSPFWMLELDFTTTIDELSEQDLEARFAKAQRVEYGR